jgi:hypothetical protein
MSRAIRRREQLRPGALRFTLLALREIEMCSDDTDHRTAGVPADRKPTRKDVYVMAVLVPEAKLGFVGRLPARHAFMRPIGNHLVLGMHESLPGADVRLDLVLGIPQHLLPTRRIYDVVRLEVPVPDSFLGSGKCQLEPLLAFAESQLGPFSLSDVEVGADDADDPAIRATDRQSPRQDSDVVTFLVSEPELLFVGRLPAFDGIVQRFGAWPVVGMQQLLPRPDARLDFVFRITEHLLPPR